MEADPVLGMGEDGLGPGQRGALGVVVGAIIGPLEGYGRLGGQFAGPDGHHLGLGRLAHGAPVAGVPAFGAGNDPQEGRDIPVCRVAVTNLLVVLD